MAAVASPRDDVMDTRTPSPGPRSDSGHSSNNSEPGYQPDLSNEVAMLSTKLVNAINYQTNLDDSLQQTRHELEQARHIISTLEVEKQRIDMLIQGGYYVMRSEMEETLAKMRNELATERSAREVAEKARKQADGELENLTVQLFEEANKMVSAARKETEAAEKRNAQLKSQILDTESLLASQQEQLHDLKGTMEKLHEDASSTRDVSVPSTPVTANHAMFDALQSSPYAATLPDVPPEHPLHFASLISPVLRNDITAYTDFQDLLLLARRLGAHSRTNSSNNTAQTSSQNSTTYGNFAASASSPNLPGAFSFSASSSPSSAGPGSNMPPLKDSKFYKRALTEDIEPTLRLDLAPGLSFLSRRTVLASLLAGSLAVEPYPQNKHYFACTLCGETRRNEPYIRRTRFRVSEDDGVSKPLCDYCVGRLRAACDFVGFLRMVRDGLWRCDSEEDQRCAWEESVRLRERMFWARLGGGVVPVQGRATPLASTERTSLERIPEKTMPTVSEETATVSSTRKRSAYITPPGSSHLSPSVSREGEDQDGGAVYSQPSTPFEDASEQLGSELSAAASANERPKSLHLERVRTPSPTKRNSVQSQLDKSRTPSPVKRSSVHSQHSRTPSPTKFQSPASAKRGSVISQLGGADRAASPTKSLQSEQGEGQRKNSSVLDRVRAMEGAK
ncbi:uncharacterized protein RCC_12038 [Ramularia collo-cygni]|uniref:GDP/GTP exchange factor Sec2 N-terminal domain-containing protein n=1 Tax=Ramularia collo-cygni TaxID=112498 RepID=A0A2D3UZS2_9PEZI|nr:uncharacterized protein RCC_12038 [Ramularia collo-cygni]CZT14729.1 uncharacterized protein RCC_12038 [Ramularia collo-cygni]